MYDLQHFMIMQANPIQENVGMLIMKLKVQYKILHFRLDEELKKSCGTLYVDNVQYHWVDISGSQSYI